MKNATQSKTAPGMGWLLGFFIGLIAAILVFVFTEKIAVSIPVFTALGVTLGLVFEQKFRTTDPMDAPGVRKVLWGLLAVGVLVFVVFLWILR